MSYTRQDLENIKQAELDLVMGKRIVSLTFNGRTTTFAACDIDQVRRMKIEIQKALGDVSKKIKRVAVTQDCSNRGY